MGVKPLSDRSRMPLKSHVMGRFKSLESIAKEQKDKVGMIAVELNALWRHPACIRSSHPCKTRKAPAR
ncbi:Hypothetical protein FKW44_008078, partial [Caligus rogercresseyi]